jgi:hypothetical protein
MEQEVDFSIEEITNQALLKIPRHFLLPFFQICLPRFIFSWRRMLFFFSSTLSSSSHSAVCRWNRILRMSSHRALKEVDSLKRELRSLGEQVHQFEEKLKSVESSSTSSEVIRLIQRFDQVKSRMAQAVKVLSEAQKFEETFRAFERNSQDSQGIEKVFLLMISLQLNCCLDFLILFSPFSLSIVWAFPFRNFSLL